MRSLLRPCALLVLAAACSSGPQIRDRTKVEDGDAAATRPEQGQAGEQQQPPPPAVAPRAFDPKATAAGFAQPGLCEEEARRLAAANRDQGWALLRECVNRGLTSLKRLAGDGFWIEDLLARKDASVVLTKVIAARGGDIDGDLAVLHQRRISLFSLAMAMEQPKLYAGRLVVTRLRVDGMKDEAGPLALLVAETAVGSVTKEVKTGSTSVSSTSGSRSYGASGDYSGTSRHQSESYAQRHENQVAETGRAGLLRLAKSDPFLAPGREFIVLARFDGVRASGSAEDGDEASLALLTVVSYFEPSALLIE